MFKTKSADWFFIIPATLVWLSAVIVTAWDFMRIKRGRQHFAFLHLVGLCSMILGVVIRLQAKKSLGKHFSAGLRTLDEHKLVKTGLYSHVRHPAYTGNFLVWFAVPLVFSSGYGLLVMLLLVPCFLYRIHVEENMLIEKFGDEYLEYRKHTRKLIPYIY